MSDTGLVLDLCAGPGGWDQGALPLGIHPVGIENDAAACATRAAARHPTIRADVATWPLGHMPRVTGLIASPPCQAFSQAGNGDGREWLGALHAHARACLTGWHPWPHDTDPRIALVLEPLRYALTLVPEWVALEQVPPILPLWRTYTTVLEALGWRCWAGVLNAADYGVPQTRERAILLAHRRRQPQPPEPTHCRRGGASSLFGELAPWVSMVEALGWDGFDLGFPRRDDRGDSPDGYRERDWRGADEPAANLTSKARSWTFRNGAQANAADTPNPRPPWPATRASPRAPVADGDYDGDEPIRLGIEDALVLQSFPADYPLRGSRTKQYEQVGNAVPPLLAQRILEALLA